MDRKQNTRFAQSSVASVGLALMLPIIASSCSSRAQPSGDGDGAGGAGVLRSSDSAGPQGGVATAKLGRACDDTSRCEQGSVCASFIGLGLDVDAAAAYCIAGDVCDVVTCVPGRRCVATEGDPEQVRCEPSPDGG
jgi:hypothetical protein